MKRKRSRNSRQPRRALAFAFLCALVLMLAPVRAMATHFVGSPPLPAHESAWILIDGDDPAAGTTATIDAAERFATKTLRLGEGHPKTPSVFRFSPKTHDLAAVERSFARSGDLGKALEEAVPAVVVLFVEGKALPLGPGYGSTALTPAWLAARVQDLGTLCPLSLLVVIVEPGAPDSRDTLVAAASGRDAPFYLMLDVVGQGRTTSAPLSSVLATLKPDAALEAEVGKVFAGPRDGPVGIVGALFLTALLGGADDLDGNGYDIIEVASWMLAQHGDIANAALWGKDKTSSAESARAYPLKRRRYTVGVCPASVQPLPALPNLPKESDASRAARTKAALADLAESFIVGATSAAPDALVIKVLDPATVSVPGATPSQRPKGPGACARTTARRGFDVWVEIFHDHDDHYILRASWSRTRSSIMEEMNPLPDRDKTRELLSDIARSIAKPARIYNPIPDSQIAAGPVVTPPRFTEANVLFKQARGAYEAGDCPKALPLFKRSYETYPTPEALLGMATCEEQLGLVGEEREHLEALAERASAGNAYAAAARQRLTEPPQSTPADFTSHRNQRVAGFVIGGVGLLGLGIGSAAGSVAIVKKNDVTGLCPVPSQCTEEGVSLARTARTAANVSTAALIVGAVLAGVGLTFTLVSRRATSVTVLTNGTDAAGVRLEHAF